jgi:hypothetical protein
LSVSSGTLSAVDETTIEQLMATAELDPVAATARRALCLTLTVAFRRVGLLLQTGGSIVGGDRVSGQSPFAFGNDAVVGLATVIEIAGELLSGTVQLLEDHNHYAAAALIRQLVEVEYLAWAFGGDEEEARNWLRSSAQERREMWQPRHLRDRAAGQFRGTDYGYHCELGGHPTPSALPMLPSRLAERSGARWWFDLAAHSVSVWNYALVAIDKCGYSQHLPEPGTAEAVSVAVDHWRKVDGIVAAISEIRRLNEATAEAASTG